jgi:hypothetical protein
MSTPNTHLLRIAEIEGRLRTALLNANQPSASAPSWRKLAGITPMRARPSGTPMPTPRRAMPS